MDSTTNTNMKLTTIFFNRISTPFPEKQINEVEGRIEMELKKKTTTNNQATFRDKEGHNLKKKIARHHQEAKLKTWSRRGPIERPDNFFPI